LLSLLRFALSLLVNTVSLLVICLSLLREYVSFFVDQHDHGQPLGHALD